MAVSRRYQFINWFPRWRGLGFCRETGNWNYVYAWRVWFGWWELRRWSTRKAPKGGQR